MPWDKMKEHNRSEVIMSAAYPAPYYLHLPGLCKNSKILLLFITVVNLKKLGEVVSVFFILITVAG